MDIKWNQPIVKEGQSFKDLKIKPITIPATSDVEKGYLFVAPFAGIEDTPFEQHGEQLQIDRLCQRDIVNTALL